MKKVILTGSSGMIGKGVLLECLDNNQIEEVLVINRQPTTINHPKLKEVIHQDFLEFESIKGALHGFDACIHCMGVSAMGMNESDYFKLTFSVTESLAKTLYQLNENITFIYVTGSGTDSSEKGPMMWARIKGKTENMLFNMGFNDVYAFRPGGIIPEKGTKPKVVYIQLILSIFRPLFPILKLFPAITTTSRIGQAMINVLLTPINKKVLMGSDINQICKRHTGWCHQ